MKPLPLLLVALLAAFALPAAAGPGNVSQWTDARPPPGCSSTITWFADQGLAVFEQNSVPFTYTTCMWETWEQDIQFYGCGSYEWAALYCSYGYDYYSGGFASLRVNHDGAWQIAEYWCTPLCSYPPTVVASGTAVQVL